MRRRSATLLIGLGMLAASCGGADSTAESSTTTPPTTAATTTTTDPPTATTTTSVSPPATTSTTTITEPPPPSVDGYVVAAASIFPAEPLPTSDGAGGSGCAPGPGALPDGIWYGTVLASDQDSVEFDLACFYFGEIAHTVAAQVGEEAYNDYWITNDASTLRTVPVAAAGVVWSIPAQLSSDLVPLSFATDWPADWERAYAACPGESCGVWVYINEGVATEMVEQYVP